MSARTRAQYMSAKCYDCGRVVRCYTPAAGDGSVEVYSSHKRPDGSCCAGGKAEVEPEDMVTGRDTFGAQPNPTGGGATSA